MKSRGSAWCKVGTRPTSCAFDLAVFRVRSVRELVNQRIEDRVKLLGVGRIGNTEHAIHQVTDRHHVDCNLPYPPKQHDIRTVADGERRLQRSWASWGEMRVRSSPSSGMSSAESAPVTPIIHRCCAPTPPRVAPPTEGTRSTRPTVCSSCFRACARGLTPSGFGCGHEIR